jgi:PEP-CTERM motif
MGATETAHPSREAEGAATVTAAVAEGHLRAAAGVVVLPGRALDTVRMEVVQEAFSLSVAARVSAAASVDLGAAAVIRSLETAQHTPLAGVVGAAAIAAAVAARAHRRDYRFNGAGGGGGGSFDGGTNPILVANYRTGNGEIEITEMTGTPAVPEPGTVALVSTGLVGLVALRRRRRKT